MCLNEAATDGQAQSNTAARALASPVDLIETLKNALGLIRRQTRTVIGYAQIDATILLCLRITSVQIYFRLFSGAVLCVLQQIAQNHLHPAPIDIEQWDLKRQNNLDRLPIFCRLHDVLNKYIQAAQGRRE